MVKRFLLSLAVVAIVLLAVAYALPRKVHVERSVEIDAPQASVFALVNGLRRFNEWSPWFPLDPQARYRYDGPVVGVGARMSWEGNGDVGSGSQGIVESVPCDRVRTVLDFGPKGRAEGLFTLVPDGAGTKVTWGFDTDLGMNPASRWFGLRFDRRIGRDYERGLEALKATAEKMPRVDISKLEVETLDVTPVLVASVESSAPNAAEAIAEAVSRARAAVEAFLRTHRLERAGPPMTVNTKWDGTEYRFEAAVPIRPPEKDLPADASVLVKKSYGGAALKVVHRGPYGTMPALYEKLFAYASAYGYEHAGPPWEEYVTDPEITPEADLITHIFLPVK